MSFIVTVRTQLKGRKKMYFEKLRKKREDETDASILREMIKFYMDHHPIE